MKLPQIFLILTPSLLAAFLALELSLAFPVRMTAGLALRYFAFLAIFFTSDAGIVLLLFPCLTSAAIFSLPLFAIRSTSPNRNFLLYSTSYPAFSYLLPALFSETFPSYISAYYHSPSGALPYFSKSLYSGLSTTAALSKAETRVFISLLFISACLWA